MTDTNASYSSGDAPVFICPLCQSPLTIADKTWQCDGSHIANNPKQTQHSFDVARQGYVNLLPVQQKKSKAPGDSEASIAARQRFLHAGHYQPLQQLLCQTLSQLSQTGEKAADETEKSSISTEQPAKYWADIGSGEGYYTLEMAEQMRIEGLIAIDISKPAVVTLAKMAKAQHQLWYQPHLSNEHLPTIIYPLVASAVNLPLANQSLDGISSIFSPILPEIFADKLKDKGWLIIAKPDSGHLQSMREALFDNVREHDSDKFLTQLEPYFEWRAVHHIEQSLSLNSESLADLLTMTPYSYRAKPAKREALLASAKQDAFVTEAKFVLYVLQKR